LPEVTHVSNQYVQLGLRRCIALQVGNNPVMPAAAAAAAAHVFRASFG